MLRLASKLKCNGLELNLSFLHAGMASVMNWRELVAGINANLLLTFVFFCCRMKLIIITFCLIGAAFANPVSIKLI